MVDSRWVVFSPLFRQKMHLTTWEKFQHNTVDSPGVPCARAQKLFMYTLKYMRRDQNWMVVMCIKKAVGYWYRMVQVQPVVMSSLGEGRVSVMVSRGYGIVS